MAEAIEYCRLDSYIADSKEARRLIFGRIANQIRQPLSNRRLFNLTFVSLPDFL